MACDKRSFSPTTGEKGQPASEEQLSELAARVNKKSSVRRTVSAHLATPKPVTLNSHARYPEWPYYETPTLASVLL
jgi:hypothetical protein